MIVVEIVIVILVVFVFVAVIVIMIMNMIMVLLLLRQSLQRIFTINILVVICFVIGVEVGI